MVKWTVLKPIQDVWPHVATSALVLNLLVGGVFLPNYNRHDPLWGYIIYTCNISFPCFI